MKKIALINDLSGFGRCSLTAAIPVISALGLEACPLPTAILSAQTGFPSYYLTDYTCHMDAYIEEWEKMNIAFDGIYSGYLANPLQTQKVMRFLDHFQKEDTFYLADPVMGDDGNPYPIFSKSLLECMQTLTKHATVITPNLTELCLLAGIPYDELCAHHGKEDYLARIQEVCLTLLKQNPSSHRQTIIVTGILQVDAEGTFVTNLAVSDKGCACTCSPYTGISFSGTGDLFASAICGYLLKGHPLQEAMDKATAFLQPAIEEATNVGIPRDFGIPFQKYLSRLM